jgi:hypothetical protein
MLSANSVDEADSGSPELSFTVTLVGEVDAPVTVDFDTSDGSATEGDDYTAVSTNVTATSAGVVVKVMILPENLAEMNETVLGTLSAISSSGRAVTFASSEASGTILNDDFTPIAKDDGVFSVVEDSSLVVLPASGLLVNDTDADDGDGVDNLSVTQIIDDVDHGSLTLNEDGSFTYIPAENYFGVDQFIYELSDGTNASQGTVDLLVEERIDLAVVIEVLQDPIVAGGAAFDVFRVTLSNNGPSDATGIQLNQSSILPADTELTHAVASLGTFNEGAWTLDLAEGASATLTLEMQAGADAVSGVDVLPFAIELITSDQLDTNASNNADSASISVINANDAELAINTATEINLQNGLLTQELQVTNNGAVTVPGFRIYVSNLPEDVSLYNASGKALFEDSAEELPYLLYNIALASGESVLIDVQFFRPSLDLDFSPVFLVEYLPYPDTALDKADSGIPVERFTLLNNGDVLIEIASVPGATYALEYTDSLEDEFIRTTQTITAAANRLQVIDSGPPLTATPPAEAPSRFYRFVQLTTVD